MEWGIPVEIRDEGERRQRGEVTRRGDRPCMWPVVMLPEDKLMEQKGSLGKTQAASNRSHRAGL